MKNRLEALRKERNLTQAELGFALGISRQTVISIERGKYNPSITLAFRISNFFDKSIEDIFIYEEEEE